MEGAAFRKHTASQPLWISLRFEWGRPMNRNEFYDAKSITALDINLAWATLELLTDDVEDIQLLISGNEEDVDELKVSVNDGKLTIEQPAYGLTTHITMVRWMQVMLRLPSVWKGVIEASTVAGPLRARGLTGSDLTLTTVSGDLLASDLSAIVMHVRTVTGCLTLRTAGAETLKARTVSGDFRLSEGDFRKITVNGVSSDLRIDLATVFEQMDATTVAGDIMIYAPTREANISLRSATGRLRTSEVSITDEGPVLNVVTVSGNLTVSGKNL